MIQIICKKFRTTFYTSRENSEAKVLWANVINYINKMAIYKLEFITDGLLIRLNWLTFKFLVKRGMTSNMSPR